MDHVGVTREVSLPGEGDATNQTLEVPGLEVGLVVPLHVALPTEVLLTLGTAKDLRLIMNCTDVFIETLRKTVFFLA